MPNTSFEHFTYINLINLHSIPYGITIKIISIFLIRKLKRCVYPPAVTRLVWSPYSCNHYTLLRDEMTRKSSLINNPVHCIPGLKSTELKFWKWPKYQLFQFLCFRDEETNSLQHGKKLSSGRFKADSNHVWIQVMFFPSPSTDKS